MEKSQKVTDLSVSGGIAPHDCMKVNLRFFFNGVGAGGGVNLLFHGRTLKMSAILRCCGREQWFSMDRMTGMSELTKALRLIASTTS